jgi:hypothetical protein
MEFEAMSVCGRLFGSQLLGLTVVVAAEAYSAPVSCERHGGAFSNSLSAAFDIDRLESRTNWMKRSPTLNIFGVSPYVSVTWPE